MLRATKFEFEQRFWIIGAIFWAGFSLSFIDHRNFSVAMLHLVAPSIDPDSAGGITRLRWIFAGGALLVFLAAALRTWSTAYLRTEIVHDAKQHSEALVADGPFRHLRNPLYSANILMAAGFGVLASRTGCLFIVVGMWLFSRRLIGREEEGLIQSQGESYRAYLKSVPRLFPSLTPRIPSSARQPRWAQAIAGELFVWIFGLALLNFAITLNLKRTAIVFFSSFAVYFIAVTLVKKRAAKHT
jgi:protein-S-isoprenylcysteine O-methyltransferase Ste14